MTKQKIHIIDFEILYNIFDEIKDYLEFQIFHYKNEESFLNTTNLKKYNCFIFCYHDQALVAYKYISKNRGINFTGGLSILRTSPDHGTAYDIAGKGLASDKSLLKAISLAYKLIKN